MNRMRMAVAIALICAACSRQGPDVAGGWTDTETGPKVAGVIKRSDGTGAAGALVLLRPMDYLAGAPGGPDSLGASASGGSVRDGVCDSTGRFEFDTLAGGPYLIEARDREIRAVALRASIDRPKGVYVLPAAKAGPVGTLSGRVRFKDGGGGRVAVRIFGLERSTTTDASGAYFFGNLPTGDYTLHFSGLDPYILPGDKAGVRVVGGQASDAGEIALDRGPKQAFTVEGGRVRIAGIDSASPLVIENGSFNNPVDGAYVWALASMGRADLRGIIASFAKDTGEAAVQANVANCLRLLKFARNSGMRHLPDPVAGARRRIARTAGAALEAIKADSSEGARLLIREARKATADRPLVLITGANLTTAAQALLLAPDIADRLVVLGANNDNYNNEDSVACEVVARKGRFVAWARDYVWSVQGVDWKKPDRFPANPLGDALRARYGFETVSVLRAFGFFGDWGAAAWLFHPGLWSAARAMDYAGPALKGTGSARPAYDFIDIPAEATDWHGLNEEFFAAVRDPAAYHPWDLPATVQAEAYRATSNVSVDTAAGESGYVITLKGTGAWAEYAIRVAAAGDYAFDFRYRAAGNVRLKVWSAVVDLPASAAWNDGVESVHLDAGDQVLRIESAQGSVELDSFTASSP